MAAAAPVGRSHGFKHHAAAPPGQWINDPNGLVFRDGRYRLYVQHAADAPGFRDIGWAVLSSVDLLEWRWDGVAIPPDATDSAYSGSIMVEPQGLAFHYTRHDAAARWQMQERRSPDGETACFGPSGRNCRDPFVFIDRGAPAMLVARPCDWHDWRGEPPSTVELWREAATGGWQPAGSLAGWFPPGVLVEVPVLVRFGSVDALILSLVDRRRGSAECAVLYWLGTLTATTFEIATGFPSAGEPLDLGPDFYAAIPNVVEGWPDPQRVIVAWAASWATARGIDLPGGAGGGPITLPRRLELERSRLRLVQRPVCGAAVTTVTAARPSLQLTRGASRCAVTVTDALVHVAVERPGLPTWQRSHSGGLAAGPIHLFDDPPLAELFFPDGRTLTVLLPGSQPVAVT